MAGYNVKMGDAAVDGFTTLFRLSATTLLANFIYLEQKSRNTQGTRKNGIFERFLGISRRSSRIPKL